MVGMAGRDTLVHRMARTLSEIALAPRGLWLYGRALRVWDENRAELSPRTSRNTRSRGR
jgi:hypothetical protein